MKKVFALLLCLTMLGSAAAFAEEAQPSVTGAVTEIEKYGHALLDITIEDFEAAGFTLGDIVTVTAGTYEGDMPYFNGYYVDRGEPMVRAYPGHTNIAVCINYGRFADEAGIDVGSEVTITLKEAGGARTLQEISNLVYSSERDEYPSDEVFANFRPVVLGGIAEGMLYRSASPVDNSFNRAPYACALMEAAGVRAVLNLADTAEELEARFAAEDFTAESYKALYEAGCVAAMGLPVNYTSDSFAEGIVAALTFLSGQEGPFLVHCTEGKDRAGFTVMMLEALMGASADEIVADYMQSYVNYYGLEAGTEKYDMVAQKNIMQMLTAVTGTETLEGVDLQAAAVQYLLSHGMAQEAIDALRAALGGAEALADAA